MIESAVQLVSVDLSSLGGRPRDAWYVPSAGQLAVVSSNGALVALQVAQLLAGESLDSARVGVHSVPGEPRFICLVAWDPSATPIAVEGTHVLITYPTDAQS
jgi:hypothetical protein